MKKYLLTILAIAALTACKNETAQDDTPIEDLELSQQVAKASGIDGWDEVQQVKFAFNVARNGQNLLSRKWDWNPKTGEVTLTVQDTSITYNRNQAIDSVNIPNDRSFVNDVYWLLPQFKLVWDTGTEITYPDSTAQMVRIKYTGDDGYTPGDQYDLSIDEDLMIKSWKYYPKGATRPAMETSFENYKDYNGVKVATEHVTPDGITKIYFTDVEINK